jgi:Methyltransferase FkbM domain
MPHHKLTVHHIGARGATQAFPHLPAFDADVINLLVDADAASAEETRRLNDHRQGEVVVVSACITGTNGARTFHHAHSPYGSSLLQPDPTMGDLYVSAHWVDYDYTVCEALATSRQETMLGITLDTLIADSKGNLSFPDFLSLDTQGSELEILRGSPRSTAAALGVVCEVEFVPLYRNQPLFGEIAGFMQAIGFVFCGFADILAGSYFRAPVGLRGRHIPVTTDALFLRHPGTIGSDVNAPTRLRKLAFLSLINGHLEFAQWALAKLPGDEPARHDLPAWHRFVDEFRTLARCFPALLPDGFAQQAAAGALQQVKQPFADRLRRDKQVLEKRIEEMKALFCRYGISELAHLQRAKFDETLRHYGIV